MTHPKRLPLPEFVAMLAMNMALIAYSIDAMLPAIPEMTQALTPEAPERISLVISTLFLGLGLGTFATGPLSDRFGRRPILIGGAILSCAGALLICLSQSLWVLLIGRFLQGLGCAGPRVVVMAVIRDLYKGREMARISSFAMMIFTVIPALAPLIGEQVMAVAGWRGIFFSFIIFCTFACGWFFLRQAETLSIDDRRSLNAGDLWKAATEVLSHPTVRLSLTAQSFTLAMLVCMISNVQPLFDVTYDRPDWFVLTFATLALISSTASFLNARLVGRLGMRTLTKTALLIQATMSAGMVLAVVLPLDQNTEFWIFCLYALTTFYQMGLTMGNLTALALEPMGHIAGTAASVVMALATLIAALLAAPIGLAFNGTALPIALGTTIFAIIAALTVSRIQRDQ